jgi:hypothetical protein
MDVKECSIGNGLREYVYILIPDVDDAEEQTTSGPSGAARHLFVPSPGALNPPQYDRWSRRNTRKLAMASTRQKTADGRVSDIHHSQDLAHQEHSDTLPTTAVADGAASLSSERLRALSGAPWAGSCVSGRFLEQTRRRGHERIKD